MVRILVKARTRKVVKTKAVVSIPSRGALDVGKANMAVDVEKVEEKERIKGGKEERKEKESRIKVVARTILDVLTVGILGTGQRIAHTHVSIK